ncbi:MAG: hypothetical protein V2A63_00060 [Patescibacteria group bacterium]
METKLIDIVKRLVLTSFSMERGDKEKLLPQLSQFSEAKLIELRDELTAAKKRDEEKLKKLPPDILIRLNQQIRGIKVKNISAAGEEKQTVDAQSAEDLLVAELAKI